MSVHDYCHKSSKEEYVAEVVESWSCNHKVMSSNLAFRTIRYQKIITWNYESSYVSNANGSYWYEIVQKLKKLIKYKIGLTPNKNI